VSATQEQAGVVGRPYAGPERLRALLGLLIVVLLVLLWVTVDITYLSTHEPPPRYVALAPGEIARSRTAEFRLLSLEQTSSWGRDDEGRPASPDPGAVWVVAQLEVTPRVHEDYLLCSFTLVSTDARVWESVDFGGPTAEGESCAPDPEHVELGTTYRFRQGFQVPADEAAEIAGVALPSFSARAYQVLRPPT
jgi:hypothetical protein